LLFGVKIEGELFLRENNSTDFGEELLSLQDHYSKAYAGEINVLLEKFTDGNVMKEMVDLSEKFHKQAVQLPFAQNNQGLPVVAPLGELQPELDSLSDTIKEEVFTEEVRGELQKLLNSFARDSQPPLRKIRETMTAP
jgi:hypothetical protein